MPKITKLCLHLLKLCRKNSGLFFSGHGVCRVINCPSDYVSVINCRVIKCRVIKCHQTADIHYNSCEAIYDVCILTACQGFARLFLLNNGLVNYDCCILTMVYGTPRSWRQITVVESRIGLLVVKQCNKQEAQLLLSQHYACNNTIG